MSQKTKTVEEIILEALREGPKTGNELKKVGKAYGTTPQTMSYHVKKLRREGIVQLGRACEVPRKRPEIVYELAQEASRDIEERVKNAIREFSDFMQRNPDGSELAREVGGITPQEAEEIAYKTSGETHWYRPSEKQKEKADDLVILALISAERIRQNVSREWIENIPAEELEVAKKFLQKYPHLLPLIVNDNVVAWPPVAKAYLTKYIDEDRLECALEHASTLP
jgi:DNA-binding Lrp family transcriptional regulator